MKQCSLHESLLYNSLYTFRANLSKDKGRHHLFDALDDDEDKIKGSSAKRREGLKPAKEFSEEDLIDEDENANNGDWEYKVKSTPRKASMHDKMIDPNNPYVNQNLDADLMTVIGNRGKNRKQINTE